MNTQKPFVLIGGYIASETDGDKHYITAQMLMSLYQLDSDECEFIESNKNPFGYMTTGKSIKLFPRYEGDYQEHLAKVLQQRWEETDHDTVKKAKKKTKFKSELPWVKELRKKGKM